MKFLVVLAVAVAYASADVSHLEDFTSPIVKSSFDSSPNGDYSYGFETGNKIQVQASGVVKNPNGENPFIEVQGAFRYISPEGTPIETQYVADDNGFRPTGSHIPVPPEIPEAIVRSLQYIAAHPPPVART